MSFFVYLPRTTTSPGADKAETYSVWKHWSGAAPYWKKLGYSADSTSAGIVFTNTSLIGVGKLPTVFFDIAGAVNCDSTLSVTGATTLSTLNATTTVLGATTLTTLTSSGLATLASITCSGTATIGTLAATNATITYTSHRL